MDQTNVSDAELIEQQKKREADKRKRQANMAKAREVKAVNEVKRKRQAAQQEARIAELEEENASLRGQAGSDWGGVGVLDTRKARQWLCRCYLPIEAKVEMGDLNDLTLVERRTDGVALSMRMVRKLGYKDGDRIEVRFRKVEG